MSPSGVLQTLAAVGAQASWGLATDKEGGWEDVAHFVGGWDGVSSKGTRGHYHSWHLGYSALVHWQMCPGKEGAA